MSSARARLAEHERCADIFGSRVRILVGASGEAQGATPLAALSAEAVLRHQHRLLSRFDPDSELSVLNAANDETVGVSPTLLGFLLAARWANERSGGLVDASVAHAIEAAGYSRSMFRPEIASSLHEALEAAPRRRPAIARQPSPWAEVAIDADASVVRRPPGLAFDSGGITKGHAADLAARKLEDFPCFAVDCGGDVRLGGTAGFERAVEVTDPMSGKVAVQFTLTSGAVATSGINRRLWFDAGGVSHHVIDPGRGQSAWTGLVQATAVAPTALEAEVIAKAALLSGPAGAGKWLEGWGGVVFDDAGRRADFGPLDDADVAGVRAA